MELTAFALWLNGAFSGFDYAILSFFHMLAVSCGAVLTPIMKLISLTAQKGILFIVISIVLICIPKTRKTGICMLAALAVGSLITNVTVKPLVARPRPYVSSEEYRSWWTYVGSVMEIETSFPSGHVTATTAFMTGLVLSRGKKYLGFAAVYVLLMGASRNYLMVHYPSDVLGAVIAGAIAGVIACCAVNAVYRAVERKKKL